MSRQTELKELVGHW